MPITQVLAFMAPRDFDSYRLRNFDNPRCHTRQRVLVRLVGGAAVETEQLWVHGGFPRARLGANLAPVRGVGSPLEPTCYFDRHYWPDTAHFWRVLLPLQDDDALVHRAPSRW